MSQDKQRGAFSSKLGFVLAAAGSAVGLGNLWKFPYITWENGGGLFVVIYLVCIVLVGFPVMVAEIGIGKFSQKDPVGAFKVLDGLKSPFRVAGILGVFAGFLILSYYSVVAGWSMEYIMRSGADSFRQVPAAKVDTLMKKNEIRQYAKRRVFEQALGRPEPDAIKAELLRDAGLIASLPAAKESMNSTEINLKYEQNLDIIPNLLQKKGKLSKWESYFFEEMRRAPDGDERLGKILLPKYTEQSFVDFISDGNKPLIWHTAFMIVTLLIVIGGIQKGIEKAAKIIMPLLFLIILFMMINSLMLDKEQEGVRFLLFGHPEKLHSYSILEALGHAFFTLSLGMGAMLTYGSYMTKDESVVKSALWVTALDTVIALSACLMIFPILFTYNLHPESGSIGILFTSLPLELVKLPLGSLMAVIFYVLVFLAALTSAISLLEVVVTYFSDELKFPRVKSTLVAAGLIYCAGIPSAFSGDFLTAADNLASRYVLPIGGLLIAIYAGYRMDPELLRKEFHDFGFSDRVYRFFYFSVKYVTPILVFLVFLTGIIGFKK